MTQVPAKRTRKPCLPLVPVPAVQSPGADAGPIEAEHADRVYLGDIVVEL